MMNAYIKNSQDNELLRNEFVIKAIKSFLLSVICGFTFT